MQRRLGTITDSKGAPVGGVVIEVRLAGTATVAPIYSDDGVTTKSNPFTNDGNGSYEYFAANGRYDEIVSKAGLTFEATDFTRVDLYDPLLKRNLTEGATGANTTETNLQIVTLPARTLNYDGQTLRIRAWGRFAANGNTKTVRVYFGGSGGGGGGEIATLTGALNNVGWYFDITVTRLGATSERLQGIQGTVTAITLIQPDDAAMATDTATAYEIRITGQNGTASANDIVAEALLVTEP